MQTYDQKQKLDSFTTEKWWYQKYHSKCSRKFCLQRCASKSKGHPTFLSMRQLRSIVTNRPAAEKARSASTLNAGIDVRK